MESLAECVLRYGPVEGRTFPLAFVERCAVGVDRLFKKRGTPVTSAQGYQSGAEIVLRCGPTERPSCRG